MKTNHDGIDKIEQYFLIRDITLVKIGKSYTLSATPAHYRFENYGELKAFYAGHQAAQG